MADEKGKEIEVTEKRCPCNKWCRHGLGAWCVKYFWEGQLHKNVGDEDIVENSDGVGFEMTPRRRKLIAFLTPGLIFHFGWWAIMITNNYWHLFSTRYPMTITMVFGGIIAGMTSEGGGAVAFPVMTLALGLAPSIARDFSFLIQACGMSGASFCIFFMKIKIEKRAIFFCTVGGLIGLVFGLNVIDPNLSPSQKKMGFVSIWFSFAFTLYLLNRNHKRRTFMSIPNMKAWKAFVLLLTGFVGGCFTSFAGSGLDICSFSILCLLFRVTEKVATPTSVILMATNSWIGVFWRGLVAQEISTITWEYFFVSGCIVIFGAPFGAFLGSHFHRLVLASFVYAIDTAALVGAFAIVPQTPLLAGVSVGIIVVFFIFFIVLSKLGEILMSKQEIVGKDNNLPETKNHKLDVENGIVKGETNKLDVEDGIVKGQTNNGFVHDH